MKELIYCFKKSDFRTEGTCQYCGEEKGSKCRYKEKVEG